MSAPEQNRGWYLDLLKKGLAGHLYSDEPLLQFRLYDIWEGASFFRKVRFKILNRFLASRGLRLAQKISHTPWQLKREETSPLIAHTMIGKKRLDNVQYCCEEVLRDNIPGDFLEAGVLRGGVVILMRGILKAYGASERIVWAADSFAGLPPPNPGKYPVDQRDLHYPYEELRCSLEEVQRHFAKYDLLDGQVRFLKGWFSETLPGIPIQRLSVLRSDTDMYESTMDVLVNLYPKLSVGGFFIEDDYGLKGPRAAIDDYRKAHGITDKMVWIDDHAVYWRKTQQGGSIS